MNYLVKFIFRILFLSLISIIITSCETDDSSVIDVYVNVLSTTNEVRTPPNESEGTNHAIVQYTIKNISVRTINGWKIFFNIHLERGPQITGYESRYYILEPGEISSAQTVEVLIPEYYDKAISATLDHIKTW